MVMKRRRIIKDRSRIPGISVGEEVDTSVGEKKKVCFNINGRWFFRMVDREWRAPGRPQKARGRKSEGRRQRPEIRSQRSEISGKRNNRQERKAERRMQGQRKETGNEGEMDGDDLHGRGQQSRLRGTG
jgi:hypothetical protein